MSNTLYLKIDMNVYDAKVESNAHVSGLPSMNSVDGFAHLLERNISQDFDDEFIVNSFSYIISEINYTKGRKKHVVYEKSRSSKAGKNAPIFDNKNANISQSIILEINANKSKSEMSIYFNNLKNRNKIFNRMFFSGGNIRILGINIYDTIESTFKSIKDKSSLLIEDKTFLLDDQSVRLCEETKSEIFLRLISRKMSYSNGLFNGDTSYYGNIVPVAIGYLKITESVFRKNTRDNKLKHFYAEPVIGIARTTSIFSVLKNFNVPEQYFWKNSKLNTDNTHHKDLYIVSSAKSI